MRHMTTPNTRTIADPVARCYVLQRSYIVPPGLTRRTCSGRHGCVDGGTVSIVLLCIVPATGESTTGLWPSMPTVYLCTYRYSYSYTGEASCSPALICNGYTKPLQKRVFAFVP
jgi:hypothetical protein